MHEIDAGVPANNHSATEAVAVPARRPYAAPGLVALDLRVTQGDTGAAVDGAFGAYFTSGGGPA
jgi:hypothetical protein